MTTNNTTRKFAITHFQDYSPRNTNEAMQAAGLDWEVDKGNAYVQVFDRSTMTYEKVSVPSQKGVYRTDTGLPLGNCMVGKGFEIIQNLKAFDCFDQILRSNNVQFVSGGYWHSGANVFLQCKLPYYTHRLPNGDTVERYLLIAQGHTGKQALTMRFTHIRPSCLNSLYGALSDSTHSVTIKHTKTIEDKMTQAVKFMQSGLRHLGAVERTFSKMQTVVLNQQQQINFLKMVYDRPISEDVADWRKWSELEPIFLDARGKEFSEGSLWHPFNTVTEFEDHHARVNNPRGSGGTQLSPQYVADARAIRAITGNATIGRKTAAFTLANDVANGVVDLNTGARKQPSIGFAALANVGVGIAAGAATQQLMF